MKKMLYLLIVIGVALRLYQFGDLPRALNRDEAALGYNAFAIATEEMDEWGNHLPLLFKSFGDYKLPGYIYSLIPLVSMFGLNERVVRLPSLVAGLWLIYLTYIVMLKITTKKETSLFAAALVAVSPWAIFYSRVAFEANLALSLFVGSGYLLYSKKIIHSVVGIGCYALAIMTYNTPLLLTPILLAVIGAKKDEVKSKMVLMSLVALIASTWLILTTGLTAQKSQITIFHNPHTAFLHQETYLQAETVFQKILASKYIFYPLTMVKNIMHWISLDFLVSSGGQNPWHSLPGKGHLYYSVYCLFILQCLFLLRRKNLKIIFIYVCLLGVAILPSIVTVDSPHATRSLLGLWFVVLIAAKCWQNDKKTWLVLGLLGIEVALFGIRYFIYFPHHHAPEWQVGLRESILQAEKTHPTGSIAIINPYNQPYIYTLFYTQTPPSVFRETVESYGEDAAGMENIKSYGRWLFIGDPRDVPPNIPIINKEQLEGNSQQ